MLHFRNTLCVWWACVLSYSSKYANTQWYMYLCVKIDLPWRSANGSGGGHGYHLPETTAHRLNVHKLRNRTIDSRRNNRIEPQPEIPASHFTPSNPTIRSDQTTFLFISLSLTLQKMPQRKRNAIIIIVGWLQWRTEGMNVWISQSNQCFYTLCFLW